MPHTVLLVDDDPSVLSGLTRILHKEPYTILTAASAEEAAGILLARNADLLVCDEEMPGMSGTEFLSRVAEQYPHTVRIVLTGHPSLPAVLRAINEGRVYHFFTKPCNEIELAIAIRHALDEKDLLAKSRELLEVTRRQSLLIDEARLVRRLRGRAATVVEGHGPLIGHDAEAIGRHELLQEIEEAVRRGRELMSALRPDSPAIAAPALRGPPDAAT
jgi:two-component system probable response regulator PhcQ